MSRWVVACAVVGTALGSVPVRVGAGEGREGSPASTQAAAERLERLEQLVDVQQAKIESLRGQLNAKASASQGPARTDQIKSLVRELMADGQFQESLYPDVTEAGYDEGFYIRASDESFDLKMTGMMTVRWTGTNRQSDNPRLQGRSRQDDINGFGIHYMELNFDGHLHDQKLLYHISVIGDTSQANSWQTYYAQIIYAFADELVVNAGILDLPQGFNNLVADNKLLFVDRALAEEVFSVGYTPGVALSGLLFKKLEYAAGIFNGIGNTTDSPSRDELDTNFAYAASLIYHILGDGVGDDETDLAYSKDPKWDVGTSFACNDDNGDLSGSSVYSVPERIRRGLGIGGYAEADLTGADLLQFGAHTAFRWRGFAFTAEWYLRTIGGDSRYSPWELQTGRSDNQHYQGGYVEAAYFIVPKKIELAARLGGVWDAGGDNTWEYTFGANYYPYESHNFTIKADVTRIEEVPLDSANAGWFQNDEITMFRVAMQAAF
jgi:hypothetical protein